MPPVYALPLEPAVAMPLMVEQAPSGSGQSLVVVSAGDRAAPAVAAALMRRGSQAMARVEEAAHRVADRHWQNSFGAAGAVAALCGVSGLITLAAGATEYLTAVSHAGKSFGVCLLVAGAGLALPSVLPRLMTRHADARLRRQASDALAIVEGAAQRSTGVERAWLAHRARDVVASLSSGNDGNWFGRVFSSLTTRSVGLRLSVVADQLSGATPEDLEQVVFLDELHDTICRGTFTERVEWLIATTEKLTPEARALMRGEPADIVVAKLGDDPANKWRLARFLQALDGERKPYSTETVEVADESVTLDNLANARGQQGDRTIHADAGSAARALVKYLVTSASPARVLLRDAAAAEQVAAHFEGKGFRAMLYGGNTVTLVTVYAPGHPPFDGSRDLREAVEQAELELAAGRCEDA